MTETIEAPPGPVGANYIGGEWRPSRSGRTYEKRNPARPSDLVGTFPASGGMERDGDEGIVVLGANAFVIEPLGRPLGELMPEKSTYFYPKPLTGLVLHVMEE